MATATRRSVRLSMQVQIGDLPAGTAMQSREAERERVSPIHIFVLFFQHTFDISKDTSTRKSAGQALEQAHPRVASPCHKKTAHTPTCYISHGFSPVPPDVSCAHTQIPFDACTFKRVSRQYFCATDDRPPHTGLAFARLPAGALATQALCQLAEFDIEGWFDAQARRCKL